MKKKKIILLSLLGIPFLLGALVAGYIVFVIIWLNIPDSEATQFKRVTRHEMPESVKNLVVHYYFDPTLGEGSGIISFEVSSEDGQTLIEGIQFVEKKSDFSYQQIDEIDSDIENPLYYSNTEDVWNSVTIKRNKQATRFVWRGTI